LEFSFVKVVQKVSKADMIDRAKGPLAKPEEKLEMPKIRSITGQRMFRNGSIAERFDKRLNFLLQ